MVRKIAPAAGKEVTPEVVKIMQRIKFDLTSEASFDVEAGMTRRVEEVTTMSLNLMGRSGIKVQNKVVQVAPLPKAR